MELVLFMTLKFYSSLAKESKLKFRKFLDLITTFGKVTREKLLGDFLPSLTILVRVNAAEQSEKLLVLLVWKNEVNPAVQSKRASLSLIFLL